MEALLFVGGLIVLIISFVVYLKLVDEKKIEPFVPPYMGHHNGREIKYTKEDYEKHDTIQRESRRTKKNT
jgi:hypothetical protein